ncbi:hypothetical protein OAD66_04405 [Bacteroidia bacterium]|nr:hypothetical protein [Bacteroidia bacterium]
MRRILIIQFILLVGINTYAQRRAVKRAYWSTHGLISSATFLSDLGGKDNYGTNDILDTDFSETRYAIGTGISFNMTKGLCIGLEAFYGRLSADDAETNWNRTLRQIHVRTDILETALKFEYTVSQKSGNLRGFYVNVGGGLTFYKPMAKWNGNWYDLRPLGTEGQAVDPSQEVYKKYSPVIPFGFGKKIILGNRLTLALDVSLRKSFTDYLDDVSTVYYDRDLIQATGGLAAAHFSDPANGAGGIGVPGSTRGFPQNNDNYFLVGFKVHYILSKQKRGNNYITVRQNKWIGKRGSTPRLGRNGRKKRLRLFQ